MRRSTALLLAAIAIIAVIVWGFQPEAAALAWHVRHGLHADGAGLRIRVPLLYTDIEGTDSLVLMGQNGRVRARLSGSQGVLIFISKKVPASQAQAETMDEWWKRTSAAIHRQGARSTDTRTVVVAGYATRCYQFEGGDSIVGADIWCLPEPGGWIVDYNGPRAHAAEFYGVLASAQAR